MDEQGTLPSVLQSEPGTSGVNRQNAFLIVRDGLDDSNSLKRMRSLESTNTPNPKMAKIMKFVTKNFTRRKERARYANG